MTMNTYTCKLCDFIKSDSFKFQFYFIIFSDIDGVIDHKLIIELNL